MRKIVKKRRGSGQEISAGSMADIAFLLLIFFLVTTTIASDKGISMLLPPYSEDPPEADVNERNLLKILVNSNDNLLIDDEISEMSKVKEITKKFVDNNGVDKKSSDSPQDAIVSVKTGRKTTYKAYIQVLDEIKTAYHELRAEKLGISLKDYLALDRRNPDHKAKIDKARELYPMRISEAEPFKIE